jgi:hypothetical protein
MFRVLELDALELCDCDGDDDLADVDAASALDGRERICTCTGV